MENYGEAAQWRFDSTRASFESCRKLYAGQYLFERESRSGAASWSEGVVKVFSPSKKLLFSWEDKGESVFHIEKNCIFFLAFSPIAAGGEAGAADLEKGIELWRHSILGAGRCLDHSQYFNKINICLVLLKSNSRILALYGYEGHGRYVEFYTPHGGHLMFHRLFAP